MEAIERQISYTFKNKELLRHSLIHKSYNEGKKQDLPDNEKLEFLGDSVINLVVTEYLYGRYKKMREGELSKLKAHLVSSSFLYDIARSLKLGDYILLGKGEEKNNGRNNKKIIASLFEAIVGAIYLDSNFKVLYNVISPIFKDFLDSRVEDEAKINDYKSELQEIIQKHHQMQPTYNIINETGKPPNMIFFAAVHLDKNEIGKGKGPNKREAEQDAAFDALKKISELIKYEKLSEVFFLKNE